MAPPEGRVPRPSHPRWAETRRKRMPPGSVSADSRTLSRVRLIVARCEVRYSGRLTARLPMALRLLMIKSDGSVMVHADTGGFKPQNWMTPPTALDFEGDPLERIVVRKVKGEDQLEIEIEEVLSDVTHDM